MFITSALASTRCPEGPKDPIVRYSGQGQQLCSLLLWRVYDYQVLGPLGKRNRTSRKYWRRFTASARVLFRFWLAFGVLGHLDEWLRVQWFWKLRLLLRLEELHLLCYLLQSSGLARFRVQGLLIAYLQVICHCLHSSNPKPLQPVKEAGQATFHPFWSTIISTLSQNP